MRHPRFRASVLGVALFIACAPDAPQAQDPAETSAPGVSQEGAPITAAGGTESLPVHMGEHFWRISDAQNSAIAGDLDGLAEAAQWLVDHETVPGLPEGSEEMVATLKARAQEAAAAPTLQEAAVALAHTAASCGSCHVGTGNPLPTVVERPVVENAENSLATQMAAHILAADLMWDALLAPSEEAWEAGIETLKQVQVSASDVSEDEEQRPRIQALLSELSDVAAHGAGASADERPEVYGRFLATCGQCHQLLGRGFTPSGS